MSFVGRLVARAAGGPAGVTPRVPARFERADPAPGEVSPRPAALATDQPDAVGSRATTRESVAVTRKAAPPLLVTATADRAPAPSRPKVAPDRSPVVAVAPHATAAVERPHDRTRTERPVVRETGAVPASTSRTDPSPVTRTAPAPAAPVPAVPVPALAAPALAQVSGERVERGPDVVHVSIGRVEVRAAVTAPAPPSVMRGPPREATAALSLSDYLRGERGRR